jgi:hypothetical protein
MHHLAFEQRPFAQPVLLDERGGYKRVIFARGVVILRIPQEAVSLGMQFENPFDGS